MWQHSLLFSRRKLGGIRDSHRAEEDPGERRHSRACCVLRSTLEEPVGGRTTRLCSHHTLSKVPPIGLMKVSAAGGVPEPVTTLKGKETSHRWPQHLPGGKLVLFTSYESADFNDGKIEVVDLKTGRRKHGALQAALMPAMQPRDICSMFNGNTLWAAPFDLGRLEITAKPVPVLKEVMTNGAGGAHYDASPDGTLVLPERARCSSSPEAIVLGRAGWQADPTQRKAARVTSGRQYPPMANDWQ